MECELRLEIDQHGFEVLYEDMAERELVLEHADEQEPLSQQVHDQPECESDLLETLMLFSFIGLFEFLTEIAATAEDKHLPPQQVLLF